VVGVEVVQAIVNRRFVEVSARGEENITERGSCGCGIIVVGYSLAAHAELKTSHKSTEEQEVKSKNYIAD
jgi:hypothetical protein